MAVNYRLGLDADGDGFINWGVSTDTPPNLFPGQLYTGQSDLQGLQYTTETDLAEDVTDISQHGFSKRKVKFGKDVGADYAEKIRWGFPGTLRKYQQRPGDTTNELSNVLNWNIANMAETPSTATAFVGDDRYDRLATSAMSSFSTTRHNWLIVGQAGAYPAIADHFERGAGSVLQNTPPTFYTRGTNGANIDQNLGHPVVAGEVYTLTFYRYLLGFMNFYGVVYGNGGALGVPSYGRTYIAHYNMNYNGGGGTQNGVETLTFTVPVGVTRIFFDFSGNHGLGGTSSFDIGGIMLRKGTHTAPSPNRLWDSVVRLTEDQVSFIVEANKDYTMTFWVKSDDGIDGLSGFQTVARFDTPSYVSAASSFPVTSDWVRQDFYIPAEAYERAVYWEWTATKGGVATALGNVGTAEFRGFMLTEGSTLWPYHAGTSYGYDNIKPYTLSVNTKSGKNGFHESIAYEGTMEIVLDNSSKLFTPMNVASPFYGVLDQNRKVVLQIWDGDEWVTLWAGWTTAISLTPGENGDNRATVSCEQGLFRLREGSFSAPITEDVRMNEVVKLLIESSGWRSAVVPFQSTVGYNARVSENFYVLDTDTMFGTFDEGVNLLELVGQDWGRKSDIESVIKEVLMSENASMWIDREGRIVVVNREYWNNNDEPVEIDVDTDIVEADYVYGESVTNRAEVIINRKRVQTDATVWKTHRAFKVIPQKNPTDKVEIEIHAERIEGRQKTIIEYTLAGMVKTVYTADPGLTYANPVLASTEEQNKVTVELMPVGGGSIYRLRVINTNTLPMWVDIELKGDYLDTEDGTPIIVEDAEAINRQEAIHTVKLTTGILSNEGQAQSMGMFHILRDAEPAGEFVSLKWNDEALTVDLDRLFDLQIGTKISITESQTHETDSIHWIIGENISIENDVISVTYSTARTIPGNFFKVGDPLVNEINSLIDDWTQIGLLPGNTAEYDGEKLTILSVTPEPIFLAPSEGQVNIYPINYWSYGYIYPMVAGGAIGSYYAPRDWAGSNMIHTYDQMGINNSNPTFGKNDKTGSRIILVPGANYRVRWFGGRVSDAYPINAFVHQDGTIALTRVNYHFWTDWFSYHWEVSYADFTAPSVVGKKQVAGYLTTQVNDGVVGEVSFIQRSGVGTAVDSTQSYKYSLFAKGDLSEPDQNKMCVLTVYDNAGAVIGTHSQELLTTIQKWEVTIPTGHTKVWATFEQTPFISVSRQTAPDPYEHSDATTIHLYGYGITAASVSSYTDLVAEQSEKIIYP